MNTSQFTKQLLKCRSYADAQPLLETMNLGPSAHTLIRTAFSLPVTQETIKNNFLADVIQEAKMHEEKKLSMEEEEVKEEEEDEEPEDEKKMHEYEGGKSVISSEPGMEHLKRKDKQTTSGANPDTGFEGAQNQMKEALMRSGIPESVAIKVVKEMDKSTPSTKLMMETIDSSVRRYVGPLVKELKAQREAIIAQNKRILELASKPANSIALDFSQTPQVGTKIRETDSFPLNGMSAVRRPSLEERRDKIRELDNAMNSGLISKNLPDAYQ